MSGLEGQVFSFGFVNLKIVTDSNLYNFTDFLIRVFTMIKDIVNYQQGIASLETNSLVLRNQLKFNKFRYFALALRIHMLCKTNCAKKFRK